MGAVEFITNSFIETFTTRIAKLIVLHEYSPALQFAVQPRQPVSLPSADPAGSDRSDAIAVALLD